MQKIYDGYAQAIDAHKRVASGDIMEEWGARGRYAQKSTTGVSRPDTFVFYYDAQPQKGYWFAVSEQLPTIWGQDCLVLYDDGSYEALQWYGRKGFMRRIGKGDNARWVWPEKVPVMWATGMVWFNNKSEV